MFLANFLVGGEKKKNEGGKKKDKPTSLKQRNTQISSYIWEPFDGRLDKGIWNR